MAVTTLFALVNQILFPVAVFALTGGPSQPEVRQFEQVSTEGMTDLFSGDFRYNIPLLDVGGYPINLNYQSNITTDQEASWVGLGWNLNVGAINRSMRGIPDDFQGDLVKTRNYMHPIETHAVDLGTAYEVVGLYQPGLPGGDSIDVVKTNLNTHLGMAWNSLHGYSFSLGFGPSFPLFRGTEMNGSSVGFDLGFDSQRGLNVKPSFSLAGNISMEVEQLNNLGNLLGGGLNSRMGIQTHNISGAWWRSGSGKNRKLAHPTYIPQVQMPWLTRSGAFRVKIGKEAAGWIKADKVFNGSTNRQSLLETERTVPAYGYRYADYHGDQTKVMLDFNREKEGSFSQNTPYLPLTQVTYDQYHISGQGLGGMFRYQRGDLGTMFDYPVKSLSISSNTGIDAAVGSAVGVSVGGVSNTAKNGPWYAGELQERFAFVSEELNSLYEAAIPVMVGESSLMDPGYYQSVGEDKVVRPALEGSTEAAPSGDLVDEFGQTVTLSNPVKRQERIRRNHQITVLNGEEASMAGMLSHIQNYPLQGDGLSNSVALPRVDAFHPKHHASEINVTATDGSRYIYGIPAMNKVQRNISFSVGSDDHQTALTGVDQSLGLVTYPDSVVTNGRGLGRDGFYSETEVPAYAHAYLLTGYLSADYQDKSQDGPTPDDLGNFVKFNYGKLTQDYNWRMPFADHQARHDRGFRNDPTDDKAHISYGEKEIWYLKGIETRDYVATFFLSNRLDGRGVSDVHGGMGGPALQKLDSIRLYPRAEYESGVLNPIQTIHFEYDYSLCPQTENSSVAGGGKLTLKSVYTTHYGSQRGKTNPYQFDYNPGYAYNLKAYDRWGTYAPPIGNGIDQLNNDDYPYTTQDSSLAASYAGAWALNHLKLPEGGEYDIAYEADDYGYVQDRRAMRMVAMSGFADNGNGLGVSDVLYEENTPHLYVYFDLDEPVANTLSGVDFIRKQYLEGLNNRLYFRSLVDLNRQDKADFKEFVIGYGQLELAGDGLPLCGLDPSSTASGEATRAWVKLQRESLTDASGSSSQAHPMALAAWQTLLLSQPQLLYPGNTPSASPAEAIKGLVATFKEFDDLFKHTNRVLRRNQYGKRVQLDQSWMRLSDPDLVKIGGGSRVKSISVSDVWDEMVGGSHAASVYTLEYDYRKSESFTDKDGQPSRRMVSTGVAAYEPLLGGDENPFRQPVDYVVKNFLAPDHRFFQEEPIGETFFPGGSVGYSQVTVHNSSHLDQNKEAITTVHAPGYTVHEFYTAKDFPTRVAQTNLHQKEFDLGFNSPVFVQYRGQIKAVSQGYLVERNDMHGKPKAVWAYGEAGLARRAGVPLEPISGSEYIYHTQKDAGDHLENRVRVLDGDLQQSEATLGLTMDMVADLREHDQLVVNASVSSQVDMNAGAGMPSVWPNVGRDKRVFRSAVTTKVIDRYGILKEVRAYDRQAVIPTENMLWDKETGQPLLTRTWNEFKQPVYSFSYPAHWAYANGMGQAYQHIGLMVYPGVLQGNYMNFSANPGCLSPLVAGDVVLVRRATGHLIGKYWVNHISGDHLYLVDGTGQPAQFSYNGSCQVEVVRSGRRNLASAPLASVQTLANPMPNGIFSIDSLDTRVLGAGAVEYDDDWKMFGVAPGGVSCAYSWQDFLASIGSFNAIYTGTPQVYGDFKFQMDYCALGMPGCNAGSGIKVDLSFQDCNGNSLCGGSATYTVPYGYDALNDSNKVFQVTNVQVQGNAQFGNQVDIQFDLLHLGLNQSETINLTCSCNPCESGGIRLPQIGGCYAYGDSVNPWLQGIRGNWRTKKSYAYLSERQYAASGPDLREDGVYADFDAFWQYNGNWSPVGNQMPNWQFTAEAIDYHPRGLEIESRDALNNYSGAILGYNHTLVTTMGKNARYRELAFESFEDYVLRDTLDDCETYHFDFIQYADDIREDFAHTGKRSLQVDGSPATLVRKVGHSCGQTGSIGSDGMYVLRDCDCLPLFAPEAGQRYVLYAWVHQEEGGLTVPLYDYDAAEIRISYGGSTQAEVVTSKGVVIDGWQRMEHVFTIPLGVTALQIDLLNQKASQADVYFDDVRIAPYDAGVVSYVYDAFNRRLLAELDANHYATFYEYDEDGRMIRVKKETERGIATIQESRSTLAKSIHN